MGKLISEDFTGRRFGELTVVEKARIRPLGSDWVCMCDCGKNRAFKACDLVSGAKKTCGSHSTENKRAASRGRMSKMLTIYPKSYGSKSRLYGIWKGVIARCGRKTSTGYKKYGGSGIKVCDEWHSYREFMGWALVSGYEEDLTIDRIENNLGYYPGNCRWSTYLEQARNKLKPVIEIQAFGVTKTLVDWAKDPRCSVGYQTIQNRIAAGYTAEHSISGGMRRMLKSQQQRLTPTGIRPSIDGNKA